MSDNDYRWWLTWKETAMIKDRLPNFVDAAERHGVICDAMKLVEKNKPPSWLKEYYWTATQKVKHPTLGKSPVFLSTWLAYLEWRHAYPHKMIPGERGTRQVLTRTVNYYNGDIAVIANVILYGMTKGWIGIPEPSYLPKGTTYPKLIDFGGQGASPRSEDAKWLQEAETIILSVQREFQLPPQYSAADELFELAMSSDRIKVAEKLKEYHHGQTIR